MASAKRKSKFAPGARFSNVGKTFLARKAIFNLSVRKTWDVYTPETSCMKRASVDVTNMRIKQPYKPYCFPGAKSFRVSSESPVQERGKRTACAVSAS